MSVRTLSLDSHNCIIPPTQLPTFVRLLTLARSVSAIIGDTQREEFKRRSSDYKND